MRRGGRTRLELQLEDFRDTFAIFDLQNAGFLGFPFTESNQREGKELICERLDRCVANTEWYNLFPRR